MSLICPVCKDTYVQRAKNQKCCGSNLCKSKYNYYFKTNRLWMLDIPKPVEEVFVSPVFEFYIKHPARWVDVWKEAA